MIAHFVYNFFSYSGAAYQAHSLCKSMNKNNNIIFNVGESNKMRQVIIDGVLIIDLPRRYIYRLFYIVVFFVSYRVSIIHLHGWILSGLIPSLLLKKKIVLKTTMFGDDDLYSISKKNRINKFYIRNLSSVISISTPIKISNEKYINNFNLNCISTYIPNGVIEVNTDNNTESNIFCTVGVISERKGTLDAINYFLQNYASEVNSKLYVVGPTPEDSSYVEADLDYFELCKKRAIEFPDKVIITGKLNTKELNEIYNISLAQIFFSKKEGMPNSVLESMAYNCVPILSEIDGVSYDIVSHAIDGYIIKDFKRDVVEIDDIKKISYKKIAQKKIMDKFLLDNLVFRHYHNYELIGGRSDI